MTLHLTTATSLMAKGLKSTKQEPNKNTQLITVTLLYFCIKGFTITKYTP